MTDVANGLDYLHSRGVIHGNLKQVSYPNCARLRVVLTISAQQNILVDSAGHARLSDIGFSKLVHTGELGFGWASVGPSNCRWAAPESFRNGELSKQSDVFTYGFVAAEVRPPYHPLVLP